MVARMGKDGRVFYTPLNLSLKSKICSETKKTSHEIISRFSKCQSMSRRIHQHEIGT